jgi:HSP20 family molecular chaperone IbpA
MRYRRLSYRYALVLTPNEDQAWDNPRLAGSTGVRFAQTWWRPPADVCESERAIEVTVDLAGVDQEELDVKRRLTTAPNGVYHLAAIRQGPFRLELGLPVAFDLDRVDARYDQGLLRITLPKRQRAAHGSRN